jgi:hypothetical protein
VKISLRIKVAIILGLLGLFTLIGAGDIQPTGWRDWLVVAWVFGKIGFLVYVANLLISADKEIENLKATNESSERFIQQILKQANSREPSSERLADTMLG